MMQLKSWPPPDWVECVITWAWLMNSYVPNGTIHEIYAWCDQHPSESRYHVHGWQQTEGFSFRFENPKDATVFKLRWGDQ